MDDTGRIREPLDWRARHILFGTRVDEAIDDEIPSYIQIDRAHIVMLAERGILTHDDAQRLLGAVDGLVRCDYAPLRGRSAARGLYLLYEQWLIETLGDQIGGAVHSGRSRNDMNATVLRLRLRPVCQRLLREVLRLAAVLIRRGERYATLTMPAYTHYQAAVPITYGHYLAGVALALLRDVRGIEDGAADMDRSPLGAGAAGGTSVPLDTARTARLLGFANVASHSVDAVASRDFVLRLLAASAVLSVTLSRFATDLQLWSTVEFDFVRFPDALVGSSSMMPQKRNAFVLEHITGRCGVPLGAFAAAAMAMHATPFSNSVAVGTEGVKPVWNALKEITEAAILARLVAAGAVPQPDGMRRRAAEGFTSATELANRLVHETGMSFRQAHYRVGRAVREATEHGESWAMVAARLLRQHQLTADTAFLDPSAVAARAVFGGGPGESSMRLILAELREQWSAAAARLRERSRRWKDACRALDAVAGVLGTIRPDAVPRTAAATSPDAAPEYSSAL